LLLHRKKINVIIASDGVGNQIAVDLGQHGPSMPHCHLPQGNNLNGLSGQPTIPSYNVLPVSKVTYGTQHSDLPIIH
jgi:hypothetical protein